MENVRAILMFVQTIVQWLALALFAVLAIGLTVATGLALVGFLPWPDLNLSWDAEPVPWAGQAGQIALTVFAITLCFFLPTNRRVLQLETSHRNFSTSMNDITRAYVAAHTADRAGTFQTADQFESMKDRMEYLRDHPDLRDLEPEVLELAAQMSFASRDLAERYSDTRVKRARGFLEQRQQELELFNDRIEHATAINSEFTGWIKRLELEENVAAAKMDRLLDEIERVLPELNNPPKIKGTTVTMLPKRAE